MEDLIESIRTAVVAGASDDARKAGAHACRTILLALDAEQGEPLATPHETSASSSAMPQVAAMIGALRGVPAEQLLDLAIARLRAALPAGADVPAVQPVRFQLVPMRRNRP